MTTRIQDNQLKFVFITVLVVVLILQTLLADAQSYPFSGKTHYKGLVADFGTRSFTINSDIAEINEASITQSGGEIGLLYGNHIVRGKIGIIGYYSSEKAAGTVDLYASNASVNIYPLSWITGKSPVVEPYITGGLHYDQFKFHGYYLHDEPGQINYSQAEAPYLGKIKQVNASVGMGIEVKLTDHSDFIHLFSEVRYGGNLSASANNTVFAKTEISHQTQIIFGITFGAHR